jgi:formylglycine-generating enzyme required for sulfatase activity
VGTKKANELGLHDMDGNVDEWVGDTYDGRNYRVSLDGLGSYSSRIGSNYSTIHRGFRLAISAPLSKEKEVLRKEREEKLNTSDSGKDTSGINDEAINEINKIDMVSVEGGTFTMGCREEQNRYDCYTDEKPAHNVTVNGFMMSKHEVTQGQWKAVMGGNPSYFKGNDNLPVETVTWNDIQEFIRNVNAVTGKTFRLPTEAEWEYAARGGNRGNGYEYSGSDNIGVVAWYGKNSGGKTHPVGTKQPNELGLYDMSGNVYEWVNDWSSVYRSYDQINPTGYRSGSNRVIRGGGWGHDTKDSRVSYRDASYPGSRGTLLGFRLVLSAQPIRESTPVPKFDMVFVKGGTFTMGCTFDDCGRKDTVNISDRLTVERFGDEKPAHKVTVGDFYLGTYEVTQGLWMAVMGNEPYKITGDDNLPMTYVSWDKAQEFIKRLNAKTGKKYRLPTEAEWEYAARGGNKSKGYRYSGSNDIDEVAWYSDNSGGKKHIAGTKRPNELGLYDMSGNAHEWVSDRYGYGFYKSGAQTNPTGPSTGHNRVLRGGAWIYTGRNDCRVSSRQYDYPFHNHVKYGFRLALDP